MISVICGILKMDTNELIYKTETDSQVLKTNLWLPKGTGRGLECTWSLGSAYALWYMEHLASRDLLCSTENSTQYLVIIYVGKEMEREWLCVHVELNHVAVQQK